MSGKHGINIQCSGKKIQPTLHARLLKNVSGIETPGQTKARTHQIKKIIVWQVVVNTLTEQGTADALPFFSSVCISKL